MEQMYSKDFNKKTEIIRAINHELMKRQGLHRCSASMVQVLLLSCWNFILLA